MAKPPVIVSCLTTFHGYSFLVFAQSNGRGRRRSFWWHCGACWDTCEDEPSDHKEDMEDEFLRHRVLCPGQLAFGQVRVSPASPSPGVSAAA